MAKCLVVGGCMSWWHSDMYPRIPVSPVGRLQTPSFNVDMAD